MLRALPAIPTARAEYAHVADTNARRIATVSYRTGETGTLTLESLR